MAKARDIPGLDCSAGALESAVRVLEVRFEETLDFREAALDFSDPEGIHDMRVATRRLRSALKNFSGLLEEETYQRFKKNFKQTADALGDVRDEDVAIMALERQREKTGDEPILAGLEQLIEERRRAREPARLELGKMLAEDRIDELKTGFREMIDTAQGRPDPPEELTFKQAGRRIIVAEIDEFCRRSTSIYEPFAGERLHKFRIAAKRLRYALELFAVCWDGQTIPRAKQISKLQSLLGDVHDADVQSMILSRRLVENAEQRCATEWLLDRFLTRRTKKYLAALSIWREWHDARFIDELRTLVES